MTSRLATTLAAVALLAACGGGEKKKEPAGELPPASADCKAGSATATGHFRSPNGDVPIVGATASLASAPGCEVATGTDGAFEFVNVPATPTTVTLDRGVFHGSAPITPGTPVNVDVDSGSVTIGFVAGEWDAIENVVSAVGFSPSELNMGDVATADLSGYDVILLNCGLDEDYAGDTATTTALAGWVNAGGRLYVSDYAFVYVAAAFPGKVRFFDSPANGGPYEGEEGPQTATIEDEALARAVGKGTAEINFDLGGWVIMDGVGAGTDLLLKGTAPTYDDGILPDRPYAVQFTAGNGQVTFTSFHEEVQITGDQAVLLRQMFFGL